MRHVVLSALLTLTSLGCDRKPGPAPAPMASASAPAPAASLDSAAIVRGELPSGAEIEILNARCLICHSLEYVTQQRLTGAQWEKTLSKMQKWGSPITDEEKTRLGPWLATVWAADLPDRSSPRVATPL